MNGKERGKIQTALKDIKAKLEKGVGDQPPTYYRGWEKALEWVLMEV